jgi:hypothetical protein
MSTGGRVTAGVGLVSGLIGIAVFLWNRDYHQFDPRPTRAEIVNVQATGRNSGRTVDVKVDCDFLVAKAELWLVVWKNGDPEDALWPVAGDSDCGTWTQLINVGARDEQGLFQVRLYEVRGDELSSWHAASESDRPLYLSQRPDQGPLACWSYERPDLPDVPGQASSPPTTPGLVQASCAPSSS